MYIYTLVNKGSEKLLKEEVTLKYPNLTFAYSRPGFITFKDKNSSISLNSIPELIFARICGISLGKFAKDEVEEEIKNILKDYPSAIIHRTSLIDDTALGDEAKNRDIILDIIEVKENEYWLGLRAASEYSWSFPSGDPKVILPENSPSRAYLKIAEALLWTKYTSPGNETILELGSAPGGASLAMVERGYRVFGVDNAIMSETLLSNDNFTHIKEPMQKVQDNDIPRPCHILVSDVNVLPSLILGQIKRFTAMRPGIHSVYYTLKIGDKISVQEILKHIETFKNFGFREVHATQLPSNKSEILLFGKK